MLSSTTPDRAESSTNQSTDTHADSSDTSADSSVTVSRRTALKQLGAGVLGVAAVASQRASGDELGPEAPRGDRWIHGECENGNLDGKYDLTIAIYEDPAVEKHNRMMFVYKKYQYMLNQLLDFGAIDGWSLTHYQTTKEATEAGNSIGGDFGAHDVAHMLENEGWNADHDVQIWLTPKAWQRHCRADRCVWQHNEVRGGSGSFKNGAGWKATVPSNLDKPNHKRLVAHGAAMELMHCLIHGDLPSVEALHNGHGEHSLGNLISEYNPDYGWTGWYATPIAAGPDTWDQGECTRPTWFGLKPNKDGITFTLSECTKKAVKRTMRKHR